MKPLLVSAILVLLASPAWAASAAACPSFPDDSGSKNVRNQTELMLCQQQALSARTDDTERQLQLKADLQALQLQFDEQLKLQQTYSAAQGIAAPPFGQPPF